jgi:hypothetical protein
MEMATAAKRVDAYTVDLPAGTGDSKRVFVNPKYVATVRLVETVPCDTGGEIPQYTDLGQAPLGTKEIYTQNRMCGDFYCLIGGETKQVCATGDTLSDAFLNALQKASAQ